MSSIERLLEEAAAELARLDAACAVAPESFAIALRLAAVTELVRLGDSAPALDFAALAAAEGDPLHDTLLPPVALHWRDLVQAEERRVRGGGMLSAQRFAVVAPTLTTYPHRPRLEATWREAGTERPVLMRALDAAAWAPDVALGEAGAALVLCAGGRTDRVRLLPFASVPHDMRAGAIAEWRDGAAGPWMAAGLAATAHRARVVRLVVEAAARSRPAEEARLDALGRAAILARRGLSAVRAGLVTTVPLLAEALECSRPAAGDALERLVTAGLVRELTGRARDRVFAYDAACAVAASLGSAPGVAETPAG